MTDIAIKVEGLGKRYRIGEGRAVGRYKTLRDTLAGTFQRFNVHTFARSNVPTFQRPNVPTCQRSNDTLWALKDVSFSVHKGEVIGVIGRNGAGKSTLLKILARITEPTAGCADVYGRVGSLLEVGTGFHPELTGRENVYLNGAILGMRRAEIVRKFDEIVAFAEIDRFIDTPVKHYSSGMAVRLAFAVAAHLQPEILLVDEVLAVGDVGFQKKCLGKMEDVASQGRTILFVSHNLHAVRTLCPRSVLLHQGQVLHDGTTADALAAFTNLLKTATVDAHTAIGNSLNRRGSGAVRFSGVQIQNGAGSDTADFEMGGPIRFCLEYKVFETTDQLWVAVAVRSGPMGEMVTTARHCVTDHPLAVGQAGRITVEWPSGGLRPGEYAPYFWLGNRWGHPYDVVDNLTAPLRISTTRDFSELGFDPTQACGYFSIESRVLEHQTVSRT